MESSPIHSSVAAKRRVGPNGYAAKRCNYRSKEDPVAFPANY
ncbi:MAG: hypothetical protein H6Q38_2334 [Chloroflexi bacterium]|nr:hypothetical protein [Chloroflexota bacterium]